MFGEPVSNLADDDFKLLAGTYFLCEEVNSLWRQKRESDNEEGRNSPGLERRWVVYWAVGELLRMVYRARPTELDADIRKLSKPNRWMDALKHQAKEAIAELFRLVSVAVNKAYNQAAKRTDFRHRNWFRDPDTMNEIKAELEAIPEYMGRDLGDLVLLPHS